MKNNISKFIKDLKNRIINNWIFVLIALVIFAGLILINNVFDYNSYLSVIKYNSVIEGGRTPIIEKDVIVKQNFISQKNNLCKIGIYSLMPGISTNSTVNVKVLDVLENNIIIDQDVFLATLKDNDYFEFAIATQTNSKGKEYQVIVTGLDGDKLNSVQFPYSTQKSSYLKGCYIDENLQENNLLLRVSFSDLMGTKKLCLIYGIIFVCLMAICIYGINKKNLKHDFLFLGFCLIVGIITCTILSISARINDNIVINLLKTKIGIITCLLTIVLTTIYYFIFRNFEKSKIKIETAFLIIAIPIGILYCFSTPLGKIPDEITHSAKAIDISYGHFFSKANENGEAELLYSSKLEDIFNSSNKTYDNYFDSINSDEKTEEVVYKFSNMALYSPICHLSQAIGILITRCLGFSLIIQLYAGRIMNLWVSIFLIYFAVKYIPFKKILVILIALLPISMQEMASLSSDALTIAISLFFVSYILHLRFCDNVKELSRKEWIILILSSLTVSMSKIVYLPLCLLLFLIPEEKLKSRKNKIIKLGSLFVGLIIINLLWIAYSSRFLIEYNIGVNSKEQVLFILKNPIQYIYIMIRTLVIYFQSWWLGLLGYDLGIFGLNTINICYIFVYSIAIVLLSLLFISENKEVKIDKLTKLIFAFVFIGIVVLIFTSLYVQFNRVQNTQIIGIQPRYFIPLLILIPVICQNKFLLFNKNINYKYVFMYIIFFSIHTLSFIINTYLI